MVNVTPTAPPALPILYTWNNGQVYELAGLSGFGCVDTVYSTTASTVNGTTSYNTYSVLPADQGMQIVEAYQVQFGVTNLACPSYLQQAEMLSGVASTSSTSSSSTFLSVNLDSVGGWIELGFFALIIVAFVVIGAKMVEHIGGGRRR